MISDYEVTEFRNAPRPILLGHRGASKYAKQNTLEAFDLALQHGCDGFEFDVRYTCDARCVICHDALHRRRRIERRSFAELDLPCAEEVIRNYLSRAYLDIELKVPGEVSPIVQSLRLAKPDRFVISSFLPEVLEAVHAEDSEIPIALICENGRQLNRWPTLPIRAVMVQRRLANEQLINELHSAGRQVFVWTVNRQREMRLLDELGVDGLISDDTRLLATTLNKK